DVPEIFNVELFDEPNLENTIHLSKAVGEPPVMLAISVWAALRDACSSTTNYQYSPRLDTPATPERIYWALQDCAAFNALSVNASSVDLSNGPGANQVESV